MKILKNAIAGLVIFSLISFLVRYTDDESNLVFKIVIILFVALFLFSIIVRKIPWFQPFFTSRINLLTSKFRMQKNYNFTESILFHKTLEVVGNSGFKIFHFDESKGIIMAASNVSWLSWGENIYISFEESGDNIVMKFCSVSLFGVYSWGKNEDNYQKLLRNFDESLII
ncbi:MAG: hypothetical protein HQ521_16430 [Bacteroidetes bacterium]|nr:hypothetical protein [Bacteroidota bacterium]